jgi:predicted phosphodiesterase
LHLGAVPGNDVLREAEVRRRLLDALEDVDRLVLLGDVIELRHGPARHALAQARPALVEIGKALGPDKEIVVVPGNHDHQLLRPWLERRACGTGTPPLDLESTVEYREGELLDALARALQPAAVRAAYPGAWLREDVYATHGHYSDRHNTVPILERLGAAVMTQIVPEPAGGPSSAEDYEATLGPMYAFVDAVAARRRPRFYSDGRDTVQVKAWRQLTSQERRSTGRIALKAAFPVAVAALNRAGLGPLRADVSGTALRQGGLRGFAEVVERLKIPAAYVIFGHTHRAGPLPNDPSSEWRAPVGAKLHNAGSWLLERSFLGARPEQSPYRPGFGVVVREEGDPELMGLLDYASPGVKQTAWQ